jgi:hypothetical protein
MTSTADKVSLKVEVLDMEGEMTGTRPRTDFGRGMYAELHLDY